MFEIKIGDQVPIQFKALFNFLNNSYNGWGPQEALRWRYWHLKGVKVKSISIFENKHLLAYRGIIFRNLMLNNNKVRAAMLCDTSVSHASRGKGIYNLLVKHGVQQAKMENSVILGTFNQLGSITYKKNKALGWIDLPYTMQVNIISYDKIFKQYLDKLLNHNLKLKHLYKYSRNHVRIFIDKQEIFIQDNNKKTEIAISLRLDNVAFGCIVNNRHRSLLSLGIISLKLWVSNHVKIKIYSFLRIAKLLYNLVIISWKK